VESQRRRTARRRAGLSINSAPKNPLLSVQQEPFTRYAITGGYQRGGGGLRDTDMTATYPLSIHRRIEQKWAERMKLAAAKPEKVVGKVKATPGPGNQSESPQLSTAGRQPAGSKISCDRAAADFESIACVFK
jgi:hypothetical protein